MRQAFRHPNYRRLFIGLIFSMTGESVLLLVLAIWANELTGSATAAATALLLLAVPYLLAPMGGWLVDRCGARRTLLWTYAATALVVLCLSAVRDRGDLWLLYSVAVGYGASVILVDAALNSLLVQVLPGDELAGANGMTQSLKQSLRLFGPLAGAGLYATVGGPAVGLITTGCLAVAALTVLTLRMPDSRSAPTGSGWFREVAEGARVIRRDPALHTVVVGTAIAILALQMADAAIFSLVGSGLHRPPEFAGVLVSTQALGGIAGAAAAPRLIGRLREVRTLMVGCAVLAVGVALLAIPVIGAAFAGVALMGLGIPPVSVAFVTQIQRRSPASMIGRVSATSGGVTSVAQVVSLATGAALVTRLGYRGVVAVIVGGLLLAMVYLLSVRRTDGSTEEGADSRPDDLVGTDAAARDGDRLEARS